MDLLRRRRKGGSFRILSLIDVVTYESIQAEVSEMKDIGLRELKTHASAILRDVEERHEVYAVTRRGRPVGMLAPFGLETQSTGEEGKEAWRRLKALIDRLNESQTSGKSAVREISRMRRQRASPAHPSRPTI